ncbi:hypothetical protein J2S21_001254 [Peribacillus cavernae]|nr:hypothetical protein [Peribacillus cavernae]
MLKNASVYLGLVILLFASIIFWQSLEYVYYTDTGPGPGFFPLWLSGGLAVVSLIYIITSIKKDGILLSEIIPRGEGARNILSLLAGTLFLLLTINYIGFVLAASILLFCLLVRFYRWYLGLGISLVVSLCLFFIFYTLLGIPLPVNYLGW